MSKKARLSNHVFNNLVQVARAQMLDAATLREGLEALVAYHIYGEEIRQYGDHSEFINAHADVVIPTVDKILERAKAGAQ
jgi:hypothetical protein